jgi:hypothetical protein
MPMEGRSKRSKEEIAAGIAARDKAAEKYRATRPSKDKLAQIKSGPAPKKPAVKVKVKPAPMPKPKIKEKPRVTTKPKTKKYRDAVDIPGFQFGRGTE